MATTLSFHIKFLSLTIKNSACLSGFECPSFNYKNKQYTSHTLLVFVRIDLQKKKKKEKSLYGLLALNNILEKNAAVIGKPHKISKMTKQSTPDSQ